jgi:hypothetical protein
METNVSLERVLTQRSEARTGNVGLERKPSWRVANNTASKLGSDVTARTRRVAVTTRVRVRVVRGACREVQERSGGDPRRQRAHGRRERNRFPNSLNGGHCFV